jgi:transcriptional regulator with XRE-family HTH domain
MTLGQYLAIKSLTPLAFAQRIGVSDEAIRRYVHGRVPTTEVMRKIMRETGSQVTPNDFFDIPARAQKR